MTLDHNNAADIQQQIHTLIEEQNALQPDYSKAKHYLVVSRDMKKRVLAKWIYGAPDGSTAAKTFWALAQKGYLEEIGAIEVRELECQQLKDKYEKIQPQLDMLRSELSLVKATIERL